MYDIIYSCFMLWHYPMSDSFRLFEGSEGSKEHCVSLFADSM